MHNPCRCEPRAGTDAARQPHRCGGSVLSRLRADRGGRSASLRGSRWHVSSFSSLRSSVGSWCARLSDRCGPSGSDKCGGISMDSLITAAARALAAGDPLGALNRIALREDAPALALRGIAMAQLGDFARAKLLLRRAARAFGAKEAIARARCVVAEAEIALVSRDLT